MYFTQFKAVVMPSIEVTDETEKKEKAMRVYFYTFLSVIMVASLPTKTRKKILPDIK